jgi:hypothetical protein
MESIEVVAQPNPIVRHPANVLVDLALNLCMSELLVDHCESAHAKGHVWPVPTTAPGTRTGR